MTTRPEPERAQKVMLAVPGQERVAARVEDVVDGAIALSTLVALALAGEQRGVLEFATARGLCRIEGLVSEGEGGRLEFRPLREPALEQRRDFARVNAVVPLRVWIDDEEATLYALNVSGNGMLVSQAERVAVGDVFSFELDIDGLAPVSGRARVVRADDGGVRAVTLEDVPDGDRDRLVRFVFERQRRERLVRRA